MADTGTPVSSGGASVNRMDPARAALREVAPRLAELVRSVPDSRAASVGTWTVGEVAAHISHAYRADINALTGSQLPEVTVTKPGMDTLTAGLLAEDGERDPAVLADRIMALAEEFDEAASRSRADTTVGWLQGARLTPCTVACHLLEECLIHGFDIARVTGRPWPVPRDYGLLVVEGFAYRLTAALPPTAFVDQEKAANFRARFDVRLRGGGRTTFVFDDGGLTFEAAGAPDIDAHVSADAWAIMLVLIGRQPVWKPILEGKVFAWGLRPWKIPGMLASMRLP
jgi:hypothetical protein